MISEAETSECRKSCYLQEQGHNTIKSVPLVQSCGVIFSCVVYLLFYSQFVSFTEVERWLGSSWILDFESSETSDKPSNWQILNNTIFNTENFTDVPFFVFEYFNHQRSIIVMKSRVVVVRHQRMFTSRGPEAP